MTDIGDTPQVEEFDSLEAMETAAPGPGRPPASAFGTGLPAPFFNPTAFKEYYRFLFAGVVMTLGCMMPFGPEWDMAGYKTLSGALFTVISLGLVWSMWGAVTTGVFRMKWVLLAFLPFVVQLMNLFNAWNEPAVKEYVELGKPIAKSWGEVFGNLFSRVPENNIKAGNFFRAYGSGRIVLFIGAALCELLMLQAILGGAKTAKQQKAAARAAASERRGSGSSKR